VKSEKADAEAIDGLIYHLVTRTGRRREGSQMLKGFKQFLMRGSVLDLAVAVVVGAAFGAVIAALVKDLITPIIAAIVGAPDFSALKFTVNGSTFMIGDFINALVAFLLVTTAVYFFVVLPVNAMVARLHRGEAPADPTTKKCPECLSEVPIAARRCRFCGSPQASMP
jgi:large conductance mechanosensitive channel